MDRSDYVFFHTSYAGKKYITAFYVVDRVLDTAVACQDAAIRSKYKNPHIEELLRRERPLHGRCDAIVFGDPITSRVLERPLLFDRRLARRLSLRIPFHANKTETQCIGSATRSWRQLTDHDVQVLLRAINAEQQRPRPMLLRTTEEVSETLETDIEDYLARHPSLLGKGQRLTGRQVPLGEGRIDLLFEDHLGNTVVVEVKLGHIGREALRQVHGYVHELKRQARGKVSGVIVCAGVMPAYEADLRKQKDVRILRYGWSLDIQSWLSTNAVNR